MDKYWLSFLDRPTRKLAGRGLNDADYKSSFRVHFRNRPIFIIFCHVTITKHTVLCHADQNNCSFCNIGCKLPSNGHDVFITFLNRISTSVYPHIKSSQFQQVCPHTSMRYAGNNSKQNKIWSLLSAWNHSNSASGTRWPLAIESPPPAPAIWANLCKNGKNRIGAFSASCQVTWRTLPAWGSRCTSSAKACGGKVCCSTWSRLWGWPHSVTALHKWSTPPSMSPETE